MMNTTDVVPLVSPPDPEYYERQVHTLLQSCRSIADDSAQHLLKYHPDPGKIIDLNNPATNFTEDDARIIVAREHGFLTYSAFTDHLLSLADPHSTVCRFEKAADAIVEGNSKLLADLLQADDALVHACSSRAHGARLLHYIAANGIENFRQKTPQNAVEIAEMLLNAGSEADATALVYDQKWGTTMELLLSSMHPARAGLQCALAERLLDFGAAVDGRKGDCSPLLTAICFHYPAAAETLVRRGARVDTIVAAAALGRTELLSRLLDVQEEPGRGATFIRVCWINPPITAEANRDLAFVWAAMHGQTETVAYLLGKGVSPGARDLRQWTALHWAAYYGHFDTCKILLDNKAPLEARNEFGGTVLDQTLWATLHDGIRPRHLDIIEKLIQAGAVLHPWWLFATLSPPLDDRVLQLLRRYCSY